jgi:hypothetical protein
MLTYQFIHYNYKISNYENKKFYPERTSPSCKSLRLTLDYYHNTLGFYNEWSFGDKDGGIERDEMRLLFAEDAGFIMK